MKKFLNFVRENRFWAGVLAIVILTLAVLAVIDSDEESNLATYGGGTSFSTTAVGYKGLYTSLEKAGEQNGSFSIERNSKSARFLPGKAIYICPDVSGSLLGGNDPADLMNLVRDGGVLIVMLDDSEEVLRTDIFSPEEDEEISDSDTFSPEEDEEISDSDTDAEETEYDPSDYYGIYDKILRKNHSQMPWDDTENDGGETAVTDSSSMNLSDYQQQSIDELIITYEETPWKYCVTAEEEIYWLLYFANGGQTPYVKMDGLPGGEEISAMKSEYNGLELVSCDYGEGRIIVSECNEGLNNQSLMEDNTIGAAFTVLVDEIASGRGISTVIFDEKYCKLYETEEWEILGAGFIMGLAEICVAVVAYLLYKAQRFGAPEKMASVERRSETEGVEALANLYRGTGAASIGFLVHMEGLLSDLAKLYALPGSMSYGEIATEISSSNAVTDDEVKNLCRSYLSVLNGDISTAKARKLIDTVDSVRNRIFN